MAWCGPAPELPKQETVETFEGPLGGSVSVIIGSTAQEAVGLAEEHCLWKSQSGFDGEPDFVPQALHAALCGGAQGFIPKFAQCVPQKVESLVDLGGDGR